jgi:predicted transcriptional regulator
MADERKDRQRSFTHLTAQIAAAYLSSNPVPAVEVPEVIRLTFTALSKLGKPPEAEAPKPAVRIKRSVTPDRLICLECGKQSTMLKRHLRVSHGHTPESYRAKWGLGSDYPMAAPNYSSKRSAFAKEIGLGRKLAPPEPPPPSVRTSKKPTRNGRRKRAA